MSAPARRRVPAGQDIRHCRICDRATTHHLGVSKPSRRARLLPWRVDEIDLVERHYSRCSECGHSFTTEA